jgi:hypothetical protein
LICYSSPLSILLLHQKGNSTVCRRLEGFQWHSFTYIWVWYFPKPFLGSGELTGLQVSFILYSRPQFFLLASYFHLFFLWW